MLYLGVTVISNTGRSQCPMIECGPSVCCPVDVRSLSKKPAGVLWAPNKEDVSLHEASCKLYEHPSMTRIIKNVEREIAAGKLAICHDKMIHEYSRTQHRT